MFNRLVIVRAHRIRKEIIRCGYKRNVWSCALKCSFRYDEMTNIPEYYEKGEYKIIRKDGIERVIIGVHCVLKNETTFLLKDLENNGEFKSFRVWQLLDFDDQPRKF